MVYKKSIEIIAYFQEIVIIIRKLKFPCAKVIVLLSKQIQQTFWNVYNALFAFVFIKNNCLQMEFQLENIKINQCAPQCKRVYRTN